MSDAAHLWFVHKHQKNFHNDHHFWELDLEEMREFQTHLNPSTQVYIWNMKIVHIFDFKKE